MEASRSAHIGAAGRTRWPRVLAAAGVIALAGALPAGVLGARTVAAATGGNFIATGHDMDFHCGGAFPSTDECSYLKVVVDELRNHSAQPSAPILALDQGTQLTTALAAAGYTAPGEVVSVDPSNATVFNATPFDAAGTPLFSAIITASDSSCFGCDNTAAGETNINARASDFQTYFNDGGVSSRSPEPAARSTTTSCPSQVCRPGRRAAVTAMW